MTERLLIAFKSPCGTPWHKCGACRFEKAREWGSAIRHFKYDFKQFFVSRSDILAGFLCGLKEPRHY